ncbi:MULTISPECIES: GDSL-type esterase/lipase family protein [unclassified Carboxylicivirga]|uniref:GDSL-type esterase/lipase family protein n=1 Tax=Carboxylicivirga TaxID=1628153 RepID=UPI003D337620
MVLHHFLPFPIKPDQWRLHNHEEVAISNLDSTESVPRIPPDTLLQPPVEPIRDTVITRHFLSYTSTFCQQLNYLHARLQEAAAYHRNIRILHYGDSQIEGDRITAYLREAFQQRFGGSGPGLTTVYDPQRINPSVWLDSEGDWRIHSVYNRRRSLPDNTYGLMGQTASLSANSPGYFRLNASPWAEDHATRYQKVRLFIAPHTDTLFIKGHIKKAQVINDSLPPSINLTEINWEFEQVSPAISFELRSHDDVHILGCALDSTAGVSVDNIALRGQSTPLLHRTDEQLYKAMAEQLNIGMLIFQFGTNIIPTIAPNYRFYQVQLARQFDLIKKFFPDVPVVVLGISDAAHLHDGQLQAYDHLNRINEAQKAIALKYDFAFFDLYEAMGGGGAIIEWSQKSPPWALSDYIHFSRRGGKEAAGYLTKALWAQFNEMESADSSAITLKREAWQSY